MQDFELLELIVKEVHMNMIILDRTFLRKILGKYLLSFLQGKMHSIRIVAFSLRLPTYQVLQQEAKSMGARLLS